jgi:hypothetical protein
VSTTSSSSPLSASGSDEFSVLSPRVDALSGALRAAGFFGLLGFATFDLSPQKLT